MARQHFSFSVRSLNRSCPSLSRAPNRVSQLNARANQSQYSYPKETEDLTRALLSSRLIPAKAETDAAHVATAAVHGVDFLLTWNCRHIANATIVEKLRDVCSREGFPAPVICTPHELSYETRNS